MRLPGSGDRVGQDGFTVASGDVQELERSAVPLVERGLGVLWYDEPANDADVAALALCRLRRANAGYRGGPAHGDVAVREALAQASPEAVVWLASRAVSYMDEHGFPEAIEPYARARFG
jgi:ABC-type proline/glycine betaine transport system substrate-binding protein